MKYLEDSRLTQLTSDLTGAFLNTRGSGSGGGGLVAGGRRGGNNRNGNGGRGGGGRKRRDAPGGAYYAYNPAGYGSSGPNPSRSSCRAICGRVEAYTTKRAGSDKKTAHEVGERYAHEMERLNEAVEALKRRHRGGGSSSQPDGNDKSKIIDLTGEDDGGYGRSAARDVRIERRRRSRSVDIVTFATHSPRIVYDRTANTAAMMDTPLFEEGSAIAAIAEGEGARQDKETLTSHANKRNHPLEGILKQSSSTSNKRCRATSFDISTGPSPRRYHYGESSSSLFTGTASTMEEDRNTHTLIPQPSLYRSSVDGAGAGRPAMVPRRLVTDLILTLNASFPDYDFGDAQVSDFCTLSAAEAMRRINGRLGEFAATTDGGRDFLPRLWTSLEDVLFGNLGDCGVYSYAPRDGSTGDDDPLEFLTRSLAGDGDGGRGGEANDGGAVGAGGAGGGGPGAAAAPGLPGRATPAVRRDPPHVTLWSMNYFFVSRNKKRMVLLACVETVRTPRDGVDDHELGGDEYEHGENELVFDEARRGIRMMQEEEKEEGEVYEAAFPSPARTRNNAIGSTSSAGNNKASLYSSPTGDESASAMVEDTDFDEEVDVEGDVDGDDIHDENDFDTGMLSVPSQVA